MTLTIDDLLVRAEITDVLQRYVRGVDRVDLDAVRACFHPDAWDDHNAFVGPASEFVDWLSDGRLDRHEQTTHHLSVPLIRRTDDEDVCQSDTYCVMYQVSKPKDGKRTACTGELRYFDRFERRDGEWRIAHRRVVEDWRFTIPINAADGMPFAPETRVGQRGPGEAAFVEVERSPVAAAPH